MDSEAKLSTVGIRMQVRYKHNLSWPTTFSGLKASSSIQGENSNRRLILVWCRVRNHRFVVKLAVLVNGLRVHRRLLLQRRSASEALVDGGRGAFTATNQGNVGIRSPRET